MNGKAEQSAAEGKAEAKDADAAADMEAEPAAVAAEEEAKETEEGAEEQKEEGAVTFEPGMLLRIDFGEAEHDLSFDDIKKAFGRTMAYVEFQKVQIAAALTQSPRKVFGIKPLPSPRPVLEHLLWDDIWTMKSYHLCDKQPHHRLVL